VSISFAVNQSYEYDAVCLKNGFETQNISSRITVSSDAPEFSDSGISLSGVTYSSMIYYNDTVYVWGLNSSGDDIVYKFNGTDVSTVDSNINPFSKGAAVAADFRHTGELDFIIPDEGIAPSLFWIKNVTGTVTRSNLTGTRTINTGSMALIDVNNDDYMDVFVTPGFTSNTSMLLINNRGLGFNLTNVSYGLIYSQVLVMDINQDNYSD
jgi:hypothetical protein